MPSSKGKPTDPKLRDEVKQKVQNETNKDGGGKGQWSAWKAAKLSKEYEKKGGGYENEPGSKNEPEKGTPQSKSGKKRARETGETAEDEQKASPKSDKSENEIDTDKKASGNEKKTPKANEGKKAAPAKKDTKTGRGVGRPKKGETAPKKAGKPPREGTRRSARIQQAEDADERGPAKKKRSG